MIRTHDSIKDDINSVHLPEFWERLNNEDENVLVAVHFRTFCDLQSMTKQLKGDSVTAAQERGLIYNVIK